MTQYIQKLPAVFQTVTEKKFFDATFDQVFSKKDSDLLSGYLGRRNPGSFNPVSDFYLPEPSKNRTWWQLEPTAFAREADATKTNIFFYEDLLERIEQFGGNTLNQDRLFESEYYSFGPPIDYDMFMNYHNYYWVEQGLPRINISGVMGSDIIGQSSYTTPPTADPPNFTLSTGMTISLTDDPLYVDLHLIENMGGCEGIRLVPRYADFTSGTIFEFLPWDGTVELSTGRVIRNLIWDGLTWDVQAQPGNADYITIERGALDRNAWSRTNKWFHVDVINAVAAQTATPFPSNATRALRPIIQFVADLFLYKSGTQFLTDVDYAFRNDMFGNPLTLAMFQGQPIGAINAFYDVSIAAGSKVSFFEEPGTNQVIYVASILPGDLLSLTPSISATEGDIAFILQDTPYDGAQRGQTWYYTLGEWVVAYNDKISVNQAPLFQLYDHNGVELNDEVTYPNSTFNGSEIFSYKVSDEPGATVDPILGFPIVYTSLGQASDIIFQNDLITDRYTYQPTQIPIEGYYYYKTSTNPVMFNNWNLYDICNCADIVSPPGPPVNCINVSKQRVIDQYAVGFGTQYQFKLSVTPYGYTVGGPNVQPLADLVVTVNGVEVKQFDAVNAPLGYTFEEINNTIYVNLELYLTQLLTTPQAVTPVVEIQTYTHGLLDPEATGYFEIPQQLEANPTQLEISEISGSNLIQQFSSIIANQIGFTGSPFGGSNNYRDSRKNRSLGSYILQNLAPALKSMLVSSSDDLDFIAAVRFSQDEYTKFKNKFLTVALQLINQSFDPVAYQNNTIILNYWVTEILKIVNVSKEFSNAFAYSYMAASGTPYASETFTGAGNSLVTLTNYIDLTDPKNVLYVYDTTTGEELLIVDRDYEIVSTNLTIDIQLNLGAPPRTIVFYLYKDPLPTYIPSTPTKLGASGAYIPRIESDQSYAIPTDVIIGHDGSKTIAYGDYRDDLLLELEKRIYNSLQSKFIGEYNIPLHVESVTPNFFPSFSGRSRYSIEEYLVITESYLNKWAAKNRANYRTNDWASASLTTPPGQLWKLYNYRPVITPYVSATPLPGNWKGIFQYYYDTIYPDTRPWEMLGFSEKPSWWEFEYGPPVLNLAGQEVWTALAVGNNIMYADLEFGIIRQGPRAIYDPVTLVAQEQPLWARPGLTSVVPVDISGEIVPPITLFGLPYSGNPTAPWDGFDSDWIYGDGGPVEQAWKSTSGYRFSQQEFMYLMRPGPFGELLWDTLGTELSPGMITVPASTEPVMSNRNWQYVQNDTFENLIGDEFFAWFRPQNKDQVVHAEIVDGVTQVRFGYQTWISDRILFLGKNIADTFGQKIRTLDVNLANKLAGFTNKDTTNTYIESITPGATTSSLIIPSTNFDVKLHRSPDIDIYSYSGIVIRALGDGTFVVYGYDLLNSAFTVLNRANDKLIDVSVGGTPAEFRYFESGATYNTGDIVRYNGVYYTSNGVQTPQSFVPAAWTRLKALPIIGGVSVTYRPVSLTTTTTIPYGSILRTAQEVFDLMIGWGAYLESQGWKFDEVNQDTNVLSDWLASAKQFLFWLNTNWAPDASIQLSPLANTASLVVRRGYPNDVETRVNGVYSILDKFGVAIPPNQTVTDRDGQLITVSPKDLTAGGIYFLRVSASETEHVLIFDNTTNFNDTVYSPLLRARQQRLRFYGFRSNGWYGKMEAPGYLVIEDQLVPNYDTIVNAMRYYYDPNVTIDNPSLEDLARHLIGYESKSYLDNLQVSNDVQYLFYQGAIRQKGTKQTFDKLFRSTRVQGDEIIEVFEEWALKLGDFGNTIEQVSTEFKLVPEQNIGEVVVARLNYVPSTIGSVRQINILNAENIYTNVPSLIIPLPDATPDQTWSNFATNITYIVGNVAQYNNIYGDPTYYSSNVFQLTVVAATTVPGTLASDFNTGDIVDGIVLSLGDRILIKDQTNPAENGIYFVRNSGAPIRSAYGNAPEELVGITAFVQSGTVNNDTVWQQVTPGPITIGTTPLVFTQSTVDFIPANWTAILETRVAKAFVVLNSLGQISRIDITDPGYGYVEAPYITINSGIEPNNLDRLYSVWQGAIISDETLDNVVNIDIDQVDKWTVRPIDAELALEFPLTNNIDYPLPNAGYVNFNDVDHFSFSANDAGLAWGTDALNPGENDTIWIARTFTDDWNVYKLVNLVQPVYVADTWRVKKDEEGNLLLLTDYSLVPADNVYVIPQLWSDPSAGEQTDFGNMLVFQQVVSGQVIAENNYTLAFTPYSTEDYGNPGTWEDPDTLITYNAYSIVTLDGTPVTGNDIGNYEDFTDVLLFKSMRWETTPVEPLLPVYVGLNDYIWVDNVGGKWAVLNIQADPGIWDIYGWDPEIIDFWSPSYGWDVDGPLYFTPYRIQQPLINTSLFESASVFNDSGREIVQLPVYDPFRNILPGRARQNLSYISMQDPAKYNVTADDTLFSENINFGPNQVGQLWWDISFARYVYYSQPIALNADGTPAETEIENLVYIRDHWGQLFPGSSVDIYEWVESSVPPAEYTGSGIPKSTTTYVQISTSNRFTNVTETKYYFWVVDSTNLSNAQNRTMAALDVARLLQNPKTQGYSFFAPIQQTSTNNSYLFYNVQEILAYQGDNIQVQYRVSERDDQEHAQWALYREGDPNSLVSDQFWNKMVDSLVGYTKVLPESDEFDNPILIAYNLPWDVCGWDIASWDTAIDTESDVCGQILPVPDPTLSEAEKFGIQYRPRQGMFIKLASARKVFVQSANELLSRISIRDDDPQWGAGLLPGWDPLTSTDDYYDIYWTYTNWYALGYENVTPTIVYSTLLLANTALLAGELGVGDIVQVTNGTIDGRFALYAVVQPNPSSPTLSLIEVGTENSAIKLLDTVYTTSNKYSLAIEIRALLNAFRTTVMVDENIVDQNEMFFSMLNYVLSEQKNPDWLFKTSYIYVKENNIPLNQSQFYVPDQIDNVIGYITDAKPYHTKIRDYTSAYVITDVAQGTASDSYKWAIELAFGPDFAGDQYNVPQNLATAIQGWDLNTGPWDDPNPLGQYHFWDMTSMDNVPNQSISRNNVPAHFNPGAGPWPDTYQVPLTFFDATKIGYSQLFPYTFDFDSLNIDGPQTFITPNNVVAIQIDGQTLYYGHDYYVEYNVGDANYTVYFFDDPGASVPLAFVWIDGGALEFFNLATPRDETANVVGLDNFVINVDTRLPISNNTGVLAPYAASWAATDPVVQNIIIAAGGTLNNPLVISPTPLNNILSITFVGPLATVTTTSPHGITLLTDFSVIVTGVLPEIYNGTYNINVTGPSTFTYLLPSTPASNATSVGTYYLLLNNTISSKENLNATDGASFYRNAERYSGELAITLPAPEEDTYNIDVITVFVDPATHPLGTDILPEPTALIPGVIWINGERIEYKDKQAAGVNTWELRLVRRGTMGNAPVEHLAMIPSLADPSVLVPNPVWVERNNALPGNPNIDIWNALNTNPDLSTYIAFGILNWDTFNWDIISGYTSILAVPEGGLWYATTVQANFLKDEEGISIP